MAKLTLTDLANLSNEATVVAAINANNTSTETALEKTLSRDGTSPNQMEASLDMNSNRLINLPEPATGSEPLRLSDANTLIAGGTISTNPSGGGTGDILTKASATDYDTEWVTQASLEVSTATQTALDAKIASSLLTTRGDIIVRNATVPTRLPIGGVGEVLTSDGTDAAWAAPSGGGGTPGGSDTQVQFNNAGSFGGISGATTDGTILSVTTAAVDTNTTQAASTAMVLAQAASATPLGSAPTAVVGTSTRFARADHVHPGREVLTANRTYYVRTDGSDSNTGLVDSSGGAFLTIQKAIDTAVGLDLSIYDVTIQVGNGTYTAAAILKSFVGAGTITLTGDTTTPSNVVISVTSTSAITHAGGPGTWQVSGFKLQTTTSGSGLNIAGAIVNFGNIEFGTIVNYAINYNLFAVGKMTANCTCSGNCQIFILIGQGSQCDFRGRTITFTVNPTTFSSQTVNLSNGAVLLFSSVTFTNSAYVTATRYLVNRNGVLDTAGGGASYVPGTVAGSTATGGQYV